MSPDVVALKPEEKKGSSGICSAWLQGAFIVVLVFMAYFPALRGEFLWDDDSNVTGNLPLRSLEGLRQIWLVPGATQQYYPLTHTSFWVDYHLWGLHTSGYHIANVCLHALNAILLWIILRRLRVKGAWLAAAIFALHPVNVESVAWITERKNTLSGVFFLASILAALKFWLPGKSIPDSPIEKVPWRFYWLTLGLYVCAILSKTSTVGLPLVILILVWWKERRLAWKKVYPLLPFLAAGMALGCITMWVEKDQLGAGGKEWAFSPLDRCLLSARMVWFYLGKIFWPHPLMFIYPRWTVPPSQPIGYLAVLVALTVWLVLWLGRNGWARPVLCVAGYFVIMLFPILAFFNVYFFHISFVSDHFQYLAGIGPIALAAAGICVLIGMVSMRKLVEPLIYGLLLLALGALTWRQAHVYQDNEILWRDTLAKNPNAWLAHNNLANHLAFTGRLDEALEHYRAAVAIEPDYLLGHNNYGAALMLRGRLDAAEVEVRKALQLEPNLPSARMSLATILYSRGKIDEAIVEYRATLMITPTKIDAHVGLAKALTDKEQFAEALAEFAGVPPEYPLDAEALDRFGYALAAQGRLDEAGNRLLESIRLDPNKGDVHCHYAMCLNAQGNIKEAILEYRKALELDNQLSAACNNLAWTLATYPDPDIRNGNEAATLGERACQLTNNRQPIYLGTLAAAYAEAGRFDDAVATAQKACAIAQAAGMTNIVERNNQLLESYRANKPYHEPTAVH